VNARTAVSTFVLLVDGKDLRQKAQVFLRPRMGSP
jgi:hypothetical protein